MTAPAVRARHLKFVLDHAAGHAGPGGRELLGRIPAEVASRISDASPLQWLPLALDVALARAVRAELGADGARGFQRGLVERAFRSPILRPVVEGAAGLFGTDPGAWARVVPAGWRVMFRDAGVWRLEPDGPGRVDLFLEGLPPVCVEDPAWLDGVAAFYSAMFAVAGVDATVDRILLEPATGSAVLAVLWDADALAWRGARASRAG